MTTVILLVVGLLLTDGAFGAKLIGAFELAHYWLWFEAALSTFGGILLIFGGAFGGPQVFVSKFGKVSKISNVSKFGVKSSTIVGGIIGSLLAVLVVSSSYFLLWLSYYIIDNIPVDAFDFADLPQNTIYALVGFMIILVFNMMNIVGKSLK